MYCSEILAYERLYKYGPSKGISKAVILLLQAQFHHLHAQTGFTYCLPGRGEGLLWSPLGCARSTAIQERTAHNLLSKFTVMDSSFNEARSKNANKPGAQNYHNPLPLGFAPTSSRIMVQKSAVKPMGPIIFARTSPNGRYTCSYIGVAIH